MALALARPLVFDTNWADNAGRFCSRGSLARGSFGENLEWAVVVPGDGEVTPSGWRSLLEELSLRGITVHYSGFRRLVKRANEIISPQCVAAGLRVGADRLFLP